jgi:myosin I
MVSRDDMYKSGTVHTNQGEPANSVSRPTPKAKSVPGRAITQGKLLKPGGPNGQPSKLAQRSKPAAARPVPQPTARQPAAAAAAASRPVPQPMASAVNGTAAANTGAGRLPPPPPPPAPPAAKKDTWRVLYDFQGQTSSELNVTKEELVEVVQKENNGSQH